MSENTQATAATPAENAEVTEKKKFVESWKAAQAKFPKDPFNISRGPEGNKISKQFSMVPFKRGINKEYALQYLGIAENLTEDNIVSWIEFFGFDKIKSWIEQQVSLVCQAATEYAIDETKGFVLDDFIKAIEDLSFRGETIKDLEEDLKAANDALTALQNDLQKNPSLAADPDFFRKNIMPLMTTVAYCNKGIAARKRKSKE